MLIYPINDSCPRCWDVHPVGECPAEVDPWAVDDHDARRDDEYLEELVFDALG